MSRPTLIPNGLPVAGGEKVGMCDWNDPAPVFYSGDATIWTELMTGGCNSLATYNPETRECSLTHFRGGGLLPDKIASFVAHLVPRVGETCHMVWISGTESSSEEAFKSAFFGAGGLQEAIFKAMEDTESFTEPTLTTQVFVQNADGYMRDAGGALLQPNPPNWNNFKRGSFAMNAAGHYGLAQQ